MIHASNFRTKHKNDLWEILASPYFDDRQDLIPRPVSEFDWIALEENGGKWQVGVRHHPSGSEFKISWRGEFKSNDAIGIEYLPHPISSGIKRSVTGWSSVLQNFWAWTQALSEEAIPDQWDLERAKTALSVALLSDYDSDFTAPEIERIGVSFREAMRVIHDQGLLSTADLGALADELTKQHVAAQTTPRIHWQTVAATAVITRLLERGVDAVTIDSALSHIGTALGWLNAHIVLSMQHAMQSLTRGL